MRMGMIGLGRMGANMVRRLMRGGHECVAFDQTAQAVQALAADGAKGTHTLAEFVAALPAPRVVWLMVPAAIVDKVLGELAPLLKKDDVIIDGGNSYYHDDLRRAKEMQRVGIHYMDVGTSGGVLGLERGFCLMIGGEKKVFERLEPIFATLAPGGAAAANAARRHGTARRLPALRCGGAWPLRKDGPQRHRVRADGGLCGRTQHSQARQHRPGSQGQRGCRDRAARRIRELFQYDLDIAAVAEVWRRGSIITSQLLDLTASALARIRTLRHFAGRVSTPARAAGPSRPPSRRVCRRMCLTQRCTRASSRVAMPSSPTRFSPPCAGLRRSRREQGLIVPPGLSQVVGQGAVQASLDGKPTEADALVLFGATGDLCHKKIFPVALPAGAPWAAERCR
jgi:6-phosphogluconate dehydrogenase